MKPHPQEPICLISYEVARIRLGGDPEERPSFWKVYREELELNQKTDYRNEHTRICQNMLRPLKEKLGETWFYRKNGLTTERIVENPNVLH